MAQTLKSKISQLSNAYSINAIIDTARQVQKENSTQVNVLDTETSLKLVKARGLLDKMEPLGSRESLQLSKFQIKSLLNEIYDNVTLTTSSGVLHKTTNRGENVE